MRDKATVPIPWTCTIAQYLLNPILTSYSEGWSHTTGVAEIGTNHLVEQSQENTQLHI